MPEILAQLLVLLIVLCGLSIIISPLLGRRLDPLLLTRPLFRWAMRLPVRVCRSLSHIFNRLSHDAWRRASRTRSLLLKLFLFPTSAALGLTGIAFALPTAILGAGQRRR